jgi:DNA polymerase III delta prime subunit
MSEQPPKHPQQRFNIDNASIADSQVGGQAGRDLVQNQGSGNVFKDVIFNVFQTEQTTESGVARQEFRNRQALLRKVENYWIKGVLEHSIQARSPIRLNLDTRPDAVVAPWNVVEQALDAQVYQLPSQTHLADLFNELGEGRSLLILGEPGAGKTTLMLTLVRDLVAQAMIDSDRRIPVVFNLASWVSPQQSINDWLVTELTAKYQVPTSVGQRWLEQQHLLLFLDGLDEVHPSQQDNCVQAINQLYQAHSPEIVVCCRIKVYMALHHRLTLQTAVCVRSLTFDQVNEYLHQFGDKLSGLRALLEQDNTLRDLARNPLMLQIMTLAYQGLPSADLLRQHSASAHYTELFDAYIDRMLQRREVKYPYSKQQFMTWLTWLAQQLARNSKALFLIEEMQPHWLRTAQQQLIYQIGLRLLFLGSWGSLHVGLLAGLLDVPESTTFSTGIAINAAGYGFMGGVIYGIAGGVGSRLIQLSWLGRICNSLLLGIIFGVIFGLTWQKVEVGIAYGLMYALVGAFIYGPIHRDIDPVETITWSWRKAASRLVIGAAVGVLLYVFTKDFVIPNQDGAIPTLLFGLMGLVIAMIFGFSQGTEVEQYTLPNQGIWRSLKNTIILFLMIGSITGLLVGILQGLHLGLARGVAFGIVNGLIFGVLAGLIGAQGSGIACIKHFTLRLLLWWYRYTPWNYARFLNEACDRIFLQQVGGGYVFVHRALMEHFAQLQLTQLRGGRR